MQPFGEHMTRGSGRWLPLLLAALGLVGVAGLVGVLGAWGVGEKSGGVPAGPAPEGGGRVGGAAGRALHLHFKRDHIVVGLPAPERVRGLLEATPEGVDGLAKRVTQEAAEAVGFTVEFKELGREDVIAALVSGEVDVAAPISIIQERLETMVFTSPLLVARGAVYSRPGTRVADTAEALGNERVAVALAGVAHQWCVERDLPCTARESLLAAFKMVLAGEADYAVTTQIVGRVTLAQTGMTLEEHELRDDRFWRAFALATSRENATLMSDLDSGIALLRDNGRFGQLYDQWVGKYQPRPVRAMISREQVFWFVGVVGVASLVAVTGYAWVQRRLAQRTSALRASEARFRVLFEGSPDGVMIIDPRTMKPIELNVAIEGLLGRSAEELKGMTVDGWCAEWEDPEHQKVIKRVLETLSADYDSKVRTGDGRVLEVRVRIRPITFQGRTLMQAILRDITATKRAREAAERERRLFLEGPVVAFRWQNSTGWPVVHVSENVSRLGYAVEDLMAGRVLYSSIIHPDDLPRVASEVALNLESAATHFFQEYRVRHGDGRWIWLSDYTTVVRDASGKAQYFEGYVFDSTAQRTAADAVRESEERYRAIVENIPALVSSYFVGRDGRPQLRLKNSREAQWQAIFPWLRVGEDYRHTIRPYIHPDDVDAYDAEVARARRDKDRFEIEFRLMSRSGEYRSLHSRCIALVVENGTLWQCMLADVTEIRRAAEAAQRSEERYREIFNRSHDAIVVFRPDGELILDANERALRLYGYTREEFVGGSLAMVSASPERSVAAIEETVRTGSYSDSAWTQRHRDGSVIRVDVVSSLIEYKGAPAILSFNRDVTSKLRTESALSESEQRYRSFVQHSSEGVWCIDFGEPVPVDLPAEEQIRRYYEWGTVTECNDAMARMYGLERAEQMVGRRLDQMMPAGDPSNIEYLRAIIANGGRIDGAESHELDVNGNPRIFENSVLCVVEDGRVLRAWGIQRDITAKKLADAALADARERLRAAVQSADLGTWTLNLSTDILDGDARYLSFFGLPAEAARVEMSRLRGMMHADDLAAVSEARERAASEDGVYRVEYRVCLPDGRVRWISSRGAVQRGAGGEPVQISGASMDITEAKLAAEERERMAEQLRQAQKLESLGVMAGGIAHDFNNLLVAIMGNAGLALKCLPAEAEARPSVSRIEQAAARASELTRQLLTYAGRDQAEPEPIDLSEVVREMVEIVEVSVDRSAILTIEPASELPLIHADPTQARQVVMNLLSNASESLEGRAGRIRVRTFSRELGEKELSQLHTQGCAAPGLFACIEVSDTGCGMDPKVRARIFEPFFTTKFTGRGLGLTAVLGIVRRHGGAIGIESMAGQGTTFRVYFPASTLRAAPPRPAQPAPSSTPRSGTILVIDDEAMVRDVARMCLEDAGFRVVAMPDGPQAIDHARDASQQFDGILLDMTMPSMSGPEVFAQLRRLRGVVPVLLTSGYAEENAAEQLLAEPKVGFIQKPYRPVQLVEAIQQLIGT